MVLFVKIRKFLEFSKKIPMKNYSFFELWYQSNLPYQSGMSSQMSQMSDPIRSYSPVPILEYPTLVDFYEPVFVG